MLVTSKIVTFPVGAQPCPERSRRNAALHLAQVSKFPQASSASHHKYALTLALFFVLSLSSAFALPPASPTKSLQIYFVDVEGGQATLFVTPSGQSLLIHTGWPDNNDRDDHVGGAPQLAASIPIGAFIDHGENRETT